MTGRGPEVEAFALDPEPELGGLAAGGLRRARAFVDPGRVAEERHNSCVFLGRNGLGLCRVTVS